MATPPASNDPKFELIAAPTPGGVEPYSSPAPPSTSSYTRVIAALRRYRWVILAFAVLGLGGGVLATRVIRPEYSVNATIWIERPSRGQEGTPIQGEELLDQRSWLELLNTFKVLDPVVQSRRLYLSVAKPENRPLFEEFALKERFIAGSYELVIGENGRGYQLRQRNGMFSETGTLPDSVGRSVGFRWVPKPGRELWGKKIRFDLVTPREASAQLVKKLGTELRQMNFLLVSYKDAVAEDAAATLNTLVNRFVEEAALLKRQKLSLLAAVLDTQVNNQAKRLQIAEQNLESYKVGTVTLPREDAAPVAAGITITGTTVFSDFFRLNTVLDSLKRDQRDLQEVLTKSQQSDIPIDAFMTIGVVRAAPDLQKVLSEISAAEAQLRTLKVKYTDLNEQVIAKKEEIRILRYTTLPIYVNALLSSLREKQVELEGRVANSTRELKQIPVRSHTEARLKREVDQADLLYRQLENNRQAARLAEASAIPDVRVHDPAVAPTRPSQNSAPTIIFMGLVVGIGLGVALALVADRMDPRFRYPDQVSAGLGLPILGTIPEIKRAKGRVASPEEAGQVVEAFRSIRMSLAHSFDPAGPISLTISSPGPGDGKSLIASNLALSFAEAGYRTILIDGDIRRGGLHHTFGLERRPGLVDHLAGEASLGAILRPATHPLLTLIPCGSRRHLGPELLGSVRMRELMDQLRRDYQVIIMDSPPLGAGIDPFVLATVAGHLAIVLRAGETDRQLTEAKLQIVDRLPVRMLGAILNDVRISESTYKYYRYSYGYSVEVEEDDKAKLPSGSASS